MTPALTAVRVVESVSPAPPRPNRRWWPAVGGVLGLAAGGGLGFAYHDRLPTGAAEAQVTPQQPAAENRPTAKAAPAPDTALISRLEGQIAKLDAEAQRLDAEVARLAPMAERLPAARADLDRVREQFAALDRRPAPEPAPPPRTAEPMSDDGEVKALRAKKAQLGERLGPEHRDMVALDEQIRAAERRAAAARPNAPDPAPTAEPSGGSVEAERAALAAQAGVLAAAVARAEAAGPALVKAESEREQIAGERRAAAGRLAAATTVEQPPATASTEPSGAQETVTVRPPEWRSAAPGGLLGLLAGAGLGYLAALVVPVAAYRTPRPQPAPQPAKPRKGPADDATAFGLPVFARVSAIRTDLPPERRSGEGWDRLVVVFDRPSSAEAEAFRAARRALTAALQDRGHVVVLVTGPGPGDGKTTVAGNLAVSLAQAGKRVVLVDCDLRTPGVQGLFQLGRLGDGLRSVMSADTDLRLAVRSCEVGNLFLLPAGRGAMDPVDLLTRPKFRELVAELRARYEYVLIDGPPATAAAELTALADYADGAVLAVRAGADAATRAGWARDQIAATGVKVLGAVVNVTPATDPAAPPAQTDRGLSPPATVGRPSGTPNP